MNKTKLILRFILTVPVLCLILFLPAGTWNWPEAWIYILIQMGFALIITIYFLKHNPDFIEKRMQTKIPPKLWDKIVMLPMVIAMISLLFIPAFAERYDQNTIPIFLETIGFIGFILGLCIMFLTMKENPFTIKTVEVQKGHKVISTGPYKIVRHPMYFGAIILNFSLALSLGSYISLIPASIASILLLIRTQLEDKALQKELKGYKEYTKKTKYKILPYLW